MAADPFDAVAAEQVPQTPFSPSVNAPAESPAPESTGFFTAARLRYALGLFCLGFVVFLWIASAVLVQEILVDFPCPAAITMVATFVFALNIPLSFILKAIRRALRRKRIAKRREEQRLKQQQEQGVSLSPYPSESPSPSPSHAAAGEGGMQGLSLSVAAAPVGEGVSSSQSAHAGVNHAKANAVEEEEEEEPEMSFASHAGIGCRLAPFWYGMNFLFNFSLGRTSVASSTILSTTSGLWVTIISVLFLSAPIRIVPILAVIGAMGGAAMVAVSGSLGEESDKGTGYRLLGDLLSLAAAVCYALYSLIMDNAIGDAAYTPTVPGAAAIAPSPVPEDENGLTKEQQELPSATTTLPSLPEPEPSPISPAVTDPLAPNRLALPPAPAAASKIEYAYGEDEAVNRRLDSFLCGRHGPIALLARPVLEKEPGAVNMLLIFGFIGVFDFLVSIPVVLGLHFSGTQKVPLPSGRTIGFIVVNAIVGTSVADFLWAQSVLLTSPLVATLGLTLSIPAAMITDSIIHRATYDGLYIAGALLVVTGFVIVNLPTFNAPVETPADADAEAKGEGEGSKGGETHHGHHHHEVAQPPVGVLSGPFVGPEPADPYADI